MRAYGSCLLMLLASGCLGAGRPEARPLSDLWCRDGPSPRSSDWTPFADFSVRSISQPLLSRARAMLSSSTLVELNDGRDIEVFSGQARIEGNRYYIFRAGAYLEPGYDQPSASRIGFERAFFVAHYSQNLGAMALLIHTSVLVRPVQYSIPLVLVTSRNTSFVHVRCVSTN